MLEFLGRRLIGGVATLLVIVAGVFFATRMSGDAVAFMMPDTMDPASQQALAAYFGLDQPLPLQFLKYVRGLAEGEFGVSLFERRPVADIYAERIGNTLVLFFSALATSLVLGVPLGVVAALERRSGVGTGIMALAFLGYATPNFVLAIGMILIFSFTLHWLPSSGNATWVHFVMPTIALAASLLAEVVRFTRNAVLDVLSQDYLRTARAKGLSELMVIGKHAMRNAAIPIVTIVGLQVAGMVAKVVVVEAVFSTQGIGDLLVAATIRRDYPVLQFGVVLIAALVVTVSLIVDLIYAAIDPRVKVVTS